MDYDYCGDMDTLYCMEIIAMITTAKDVCEQIRDAMFEIGMTDTGGAFEDAGAMNNGIGFIVKMDVELEDDSEFEVIVKQIRR